MSFSVLDFRPKIEYEEKLREHVNLLRIAYERAVHEEQRLKREWELQLARFHSVKAEYQSRISDLQIRTIV